MRFRILGKLTRVNFISYFVFDHECSTKSAFLVLIFSYNLRFKFFDNILSDLYGICCGAFS